MYVTLNFQGQPCLRIYHIFKWAECWHTECCKERPCCFQGSLICHLLISERTRFIHQVKSCRISPNKMAKKMRSCESACSSLLSLHVLDDYRSKSRSHNIERPPPGFQRVPVDPRSCWNAFRLPPLPLPNPPHISTQSDRKPFNRLFEKQSVKNADAPANASGNDVLNHRTGIGWTRHTGVVEFVLLLQAQAPRSFLVLVNTKVVSLWLPTSPFCPKVRHVGTNSWKSASKPTDWGPITSD